MKAEKAKTRTTVSEQSRKPPAGSASRAPQEVYEVTGWGGRFETEGEYHRKNGLDYLRMYCTSTIVGKSNESSEFMQQLQELEHYYPDNRDAYEGRFWRLCRLTATLEDWLRGYLVDAQGVPLGDNKLAARLHLSLQEMRVTLRALVRVGLIRKVSCPSFSRPAGKQTQDKRAKAKKQTKDKPQRDASRRPVRKHSETFANSSEALNNTKVNRIEKSLLAQRQSNRVREEHRESQAEQEHPTTPPATTPSPKDPTEPDAVEAKVIPFTEASTRSDCQRRGDLQTVGAILGAQAHRYDREAQAFAEAIYDELRLPWPRDSREGRCELGCFASLFHEGCGLLSPAAVAQLKGKALRHAAQISKNAKRCRNPSAVWVKKFEGLVQSYRGGQCKIG